MCKQIHGRTFKSACQTVLAVVLAGHCAEIVHSSQEDSGEALVDWCTGQTSITVLTAGLVLESTYQQHVCQDQRTCMHTKGSW